MNNFTFHNPTRLLFGKGMIEKLSTAIPMVHRIMITFGGGSVKQNGVYDQVIKALKDRDYIEFWGIEPNPTIETLREAIQIAKGKQVDFLLSEGAFPGHMLSNAAARIVRFLRVNGPILPGVNSIDSFSISIMS